MKKINLLFLAVMLVGSQLAAQVSFGKAEKINQSWRFMLKDVENAQQTNVDDSRWEQVSLPHDWSVKGVLSPNLASCTGYLPGGIGWYRKSLLISENKKNEKIYLYFEGVYNRSEVYINGKLLGKRPNGYISFMYDATPYVEFGKENVVAVRVDHSQSADSRWYTGSGIYRNVWLIAANPVHIAQWGVFAFPKNVTAKQGILSVEVEVENSSSQHASLVVNNELIDSSGKVVAKNSKKLAVAALQNGKIQTEIKVSNPVLWDLENPTLYTLKTTVLQNGKTIDQTATATGFRTFTFDPDKGFALNEKWMKMKGVCLHHDAGVLGSAVPREVWRNRLMTLKELGVNAIRTSHNPQAPEMYQMCDELGLLVLNEMYDEWEFPKRKWLEGWNQGTPGFQGSYDIFKDWSEIDLADFVRRDRNHLSVFAWSVGNEVDYPNDPYSHRVLGGEKAGFTQASYGGYNPDAPDAMRLGDIAKRLVKAVKSYDQTRPTTAGLAGVAMSNETEYPGALDIAGYNYTESKYDSDHERYPQRVIYGSENRHDMEAWKAVRDKEHIFGQFLWTGIDYLGESHKWPSRGFGSGLIDFGGNIKPRGYFRQALWSEKPMIYIGTAPSRRDGNWVTQDAWPVWNGCTEGRNVRVFCYTNAAKAQLLLDGKEVGAMKDYDDNTGVIHWDIPYKPGKLEAVGFDKSGKEVSRYTIQTSKRPQSLITKVNKATLSKNSDVAQVFIQIVDENGVPVSIADNEITCNISGPAVLLGLEGSNNEDMTSYTDNVHRAYRGQLVAYIQSGDEAGDVRVRFSSPWLNSAEVLISVK